MIADTSDPTVTDGLLTLASYNRGRGWLLSELDLAVLRAAPCAPAEVGCRFLALRTRHHLRQLILPETALPPARKDAELRCEMVAEQELSRIDLDGHLRVLAALGLIALDRQELPKRVTLTATGAWLAATYRDDELLAPGWSWDKALAAAGVSRPVVARRAPSPREVARIIVCGTEQERARLWQEHADAVVGYFKG